MICEDGVERVDLVCSRSLEKTKIISCEERTVITMEEYKDYEECNVFIRRQPDNTKEGDIIPLKYLRGIHWGTVTGGVHSYLGNYYLMGYISEEVMRKTNIACTGEHKNYDRGIKVCIIRAHTEPNVVKYLYRCYGPSPEKGERAGVLSCPKRIIEILTDAPNHTMTRGELRRQLLQYGIKIDTICKNLNKMSLDGRILLDGSSYSRYQKVMLPSAYESLDKA